MSGKTKVTNQKAQSLKLEGRENTITSLILKDAPNVNRNTTVKNKRLAGEPNTNKYDSACTSSSTSKTQQQATPIALENPVILNHLFKLCPGNVLATCRLVSKQWYNESLVTWRNLFPVTFIRQGNGIFCKNNSDSPSNSHTSLESFLKYVDNPENQCDRKPYRNIKISLCHFSSNDEQFIVFWKALGEIMTTLKLDRCTFNDVEEFRKIIFQYCPNLKSLIISQCTFPVSNSLEDEEVAVTEYKEPFFGKHRHLKSFEFRDKGYRYNIDAKLPLSWLEIFSHFQSLTSFELDTKYWVPGLRARLEEFETLAEAIQIIRKQDASKLPFKLFSVFPTLSISQDWNDVSRINIARKLCLPLEALFVKVHSDMDKNILESHLRFHAETVRMLRVVQEGPTLLVQPFPFGLHFPNLQQLFIEDKLCENLMFLKHLPNLESLAISGYTKSGYGSNAPSSNIILNTPKDEMANFEMIKLTSLTLACNVQDEDMLGLFKWMPNLSELTMHVDDGQFRMVCESWPRLRKLEVLGNSLTNKGVTGRMNQDLEEKGLDEPTQKNIADMQVLEEFCFWSQQLTDQFIYHGFLKLPRIKRVQSFSKDFNWGMRARIALMNMDIGVNEILIY